MRSHGALIFLGVATLALVLGILGPRPPHDSYWHE